MRACVFPNANGTAAVALVRKQNDSLVKAPSFLDSVGHKDGA